MRIYHKIQMKFFQNFDLVNIKENSKNGYGIMFHERYNSDDDTAKTVKDISVI